MSQILCAIQPGAALRQAHFAATAVRALVMRGLGPLGAFLLTLLLARSLGAAATGAFYLATTLMTFCAIVAKLGFDTALQRFAGGAAGRDDWGTTLGVYRQASRMTALLCLLAAGLLLVISAPLAEVLLEPGQRSLMIIVSLAVVPFTWLGIQAAMLKAIGQPAWGGFIEVAVLPLMTLLLVVLNSMLMPLSPVSVAACYLTAAALSALLGTWLLQRRLPRHVHPEPLPRQRLLSSCLPLTLVELLNYAMVWSPMLALGLLASTNEAGLYNIAHRLVLQLALVPMVFASITAPRFAALYQQRDLSGLQELARRSTRLMTLFCLPLIVLLIVAGEPVLTLFGDEFATAYPLLIVLLFGQLINIVTGPVGYLLSMTGHEQALRNLLFMMLPLTLILCLLLIPTYGALGAAWAITLPMIAENLICCWLVKRELGLPFWLLFNRSEKLILKRNEL
jgi:O-antigen/teichoic acid export membrane protein